MRKGLLLFALTFCPAVCARAHMLLSPPAAAACLAGSASQEIKAAAKAAAFAAARAGAAHARGVLLMSIREGRARLSLSNP